MASDLPFEYLCSTLEELFNKRTSKPEQDKILYQFINDVKLKCKASGAKDCNLFPILRLLLPDLERERGAYNLKEVNLGRLLVKVLSLAQSSPDAQKLLNFRTVKNSREGSDFPSVAYFVINSRIGKKTGNLTVGDINQNLDKISFAEVGNKGPILDEVFTRVIKNTSAKQAKWFLRIILKDLKLAMGKGRTLAALHPDAPEYFEQCSSLLKVCEEMDESNTRPIELGVDLFSAVCPMMSERLDITRIASLNPNRTYQVEAKFDGERFQMHMKDNVFEYFSRKGFKYSEKFGRTFESGLLTPHLRDCFNSEVESVVLDGEMMGWHKQYECFGSKGMSFDVRKITPDSKFQPCYCVFDVLFYNGRSLAGPADKGGVPLSERLKILDKIFIDKTGVIQHSVRSLVRNNSDILAALNKAISDQEEGIVVKECESYYIANRRNAGWYKIKPEYTEGAMEDLDLVIIGADYAENKKQGLAKSFIVACSDRADESDDFPSHWFAVGRVATGLSFKQREELCNRLQVHWTRSTLTPPPPSLHFNKEKPDLWIRPDKSTVLTVCASELIRSTDFGTDYTLRFPRIMKVRDDKPVKDAMTIDQFNALVSSKKPVVKMSNKQVNEEDLQMKPATRRKRTAAVLEVDENFRATTVTEVELTSQALKGREICILSDDEDCTKEELTRIIASHGGFVVPHLTNKTWLCVVGRLTIRAKNVIESSSADVISTSWLRNLQPSSEPCPLPPPLDLMSVSHKTSIQLARHYDVYGDSYTKELDVATLKRCFDKMTDEDEPFYLTTEEMSEVDTMLYNKHNPYSFLRKCFIHFDEPRSLIAIKARMYGANICTVASPNLTHIVAPSKESYVSMIDDLSNVCLVTEKWLEVSFEQGKLVSEFDYLL